MENYYDKYLKYKNKYLQLKKQLGGANIRRPSGFDDLRDNIFGNMTDFLSSEDIINMSNLNRENYNNIYNSSEHPIIKQEYVIESEEDVEFLVKLGRNNKKILIKNLVINPINDNSFLNAITIDRIFLNINFNYLEKIYFSNCNINSETMRHLIHFKNLKVISIVNSKIEGSSNIIYLNYIEGLKEIILDNVIFSRFVLNHFIYLNKLRNLERLTIRFYHLYLPEFYINGREYLQNILPNTEIIFE